MTSIRPWSGRRVRAAAAAVLVLAFTVLVPVSPAAAHTSLVTSAPVGGASVSMSVDRVVLTFSEELLAGAAAVTVTDASGADVTAASTGVAGAIMDVGVSLVAAGRHEVSYRVVGQDGHVATGTYWFTVVEGGAPTAEPTAVSRTDPRDPSAPADGSADDMSSGIPDAAATVAASGADVSATRFLPAALGLVGSVLLLLVLWRVRAARATAESG